MAKQITMRTKLIALWIASLTILLSSCRSAPQYTAVGLEGGGQTILSPDVAKMRNETFSEQEWLALLHHRIHQPMAIWRGIRSASISQDGGGISFTGLVFADSQSHLLEHRLDDLMRERPLMFLRLFNAQDTEVVLTGVAAYRKAYHRGRRVTEVLEIDIANQIAEAFRKRLLTHPDVRVRWAAIQTLGENNWLTTNDIEQGLNDETDAIRITTAFHLSSVIQEWNKSLARDRRNVLSKNASAVSEQMLAQYSHLAPILLDHVNDSHFYVRQSSAFAFRILFNQWNINSEGQYSFRTYNDLPERFDWVRSDWQARIAAQETWKQWWEQHGTGTLSRVHSAASSVSSMGTNKAVNHKS